MIGFGTDTWCLGSLSTGRLATGSALVAQAAFRRLTTPRGTLRGGDEEAAYGLDVAGFVGDVGYDAAVAQIPGRVRAELLKDPRLAEVLVEATIVNDRGKQTITISVVGVTADETEDFALTLSVNDVTVNLIGGVA